MSDEWIDLCAVDDIPEGAGLQIPLADRPPLAVFRVGEDIHVTDDTCTHGEASLCEGEVEDDIVECPFHQGAFHIPTGEVAGAPCTIPLRVYPCQTRDGRVYACVAVTEDSVNG